MLVFSVYSVLKGILEDMKKVLIIVTIFVMVFSLVSCRRSAGKKEDREITEVVLDSWSQEARTGLNDFMKEYGKGGEKYEKKSYAVFGLDDACAFFDLGELALSHQLSFMEFSEDMTPSEMKHSLSEGLPDLETNRGKKYSEKDASYSDWIQDITDTYSSLYERYGPFTPEGLLEDQAGRIKKDPDWKDFASKMGALAQLVRDTEAGETYRSWLVNRYCGMTEEEVYKSAKKAFDENKDRETREVTWRSGKGSGTGTGRVEFTWIRGTSIADNIKELAKAFDDNGIDVWIIADSQSDVARAAVDTWDLRENVTGLIGMTNKLESGKYTAEYDLEAGCTWAIKDDLWEKGSGLPKAKPWGAGKELAVENALVPEYGKGPVFALMGGNSDFEISTVFSSLKMVVAVNDGDNDVTEAGCLIAELAAHQRDELGYDLKKANKAHDIYYVIQGRDESGLRAFRDSESTINYDSDDEILFAETGSEEQDRINAQTDYMKRNKMSTGEVIDVFSVLTSAKDEANRLGFRYGFIRKGTYSGYRAD